MQPPRIFYGSVYLLNPKPKELQRYHGAKFIKYIRETNRLTSVFLGIGIAT